jgi:hypothetical protein
VKRAVWNGTEVAVKIIYRNTYKGDFSMFEKEVIILRYCLARDSSITIGRVRACVCSTTAAQPHPTSERVDDPGRDTNTGRERDHHRIHERRVPLSSHLPPRSLLLLLLSILGRSSLTRPRSQFSPFAGARLLLHARDPAGAAT